MTSPDAACTGFGEGIISINEVCFDVPATEREEAREGMNEWARFMLLGMSVGNGRWMIINAR